MRAESRVVFGHPAATILEVATREGADMIVMGTHGRTGLARAMMGSVAEEIVRHADVPVVTVRVRRSPACGARRCATCDLGHSDLERAMSAEDAG
ncbi:MAG: universal stress protein [Polyangiales bacterium]